jgi:hypothetical protein
MSIAEGPESLRRIRADMTAKPKKEEQLNR